MASCKDCLHVDVCCSYLSTAYNKCKLAAPDFEQLKNIECDECQHFKDRSRFVELPCKVGDSVFIIDKKENIQECVVTNVNCKTQMTLDKEPWIDFIIVTEPVDDSLPFPMIFTYSITNHCTLFLTKEHAEQALKEREKDE